MIIITTTTIIIIRLSPSQHSIKSCAPSSSDKTSVLGFYPRRVASLEKRQGMVNRDQSICFSMNKQSRARNIGDDAAWNQHESISSR
jgi:hypothetical protein